MNTEQQNLPKDSSWEECPSNQDHSQTYGDALQYNKCSICLNSAQDPVVTLCGHLYCWPCIYMWLTHNCSQKQCPVCKKPLSQAMLVPLYGMGDGPIQGKKLQNPDIPNRPAYTVQTLLTQQHHYHEQQQQESLYQHALYYHNHNNSYVGSWPMGGIFGEVAFSFVSWVYGCPQRRLHELNSIGSGSSIRQMRWENEAERSLSRISAFLFCWFVLCLLLF